MTTIVSREGLRLALHPLGSLPPGEPYNRDELSGILPDDLVAMPAAVLVGIVEREGIPRVLLTLRTDRLRHHAGQVSFPGGRMEAGESPLDAAKREALEEIGLPESLVEPLGYLDPMLTITGFRVVPVVACVDTAFEPQADPNEVAEVFEVPLVDLLLPSHLERREFQVGGRPRRVFEYVGPGAEGRRIWGATALILHNLAQRLEHTRLEQA